jgi:hypothetical protein
MSNNYSMIYLSLFDPPGMIYRVYLHVEALFPILTQKIEMIL